MVRYYQARWNGERFGQAGVSGVGLSGELHMAGVEGKLGFVTISQDLAGLLYSGEERLGRKVMARH